ncbi:hypothetical protein BH11MYX4_BH11MYX4_07700 [soil metagenome]
MTVWHPLAAGVLLAACSRAGVKGDGGVDAAPDASSSTTAAADAGSTATADAGSSTDAGSTTSTRLNVVLITIDSLRADMPWAGYPRAIAPRLAALHAQSVSYSHAYATSSFTSKSIPGILTGRYPSELARTGAFFTKYLTPGDFVCKALDAEDIPCVAGHAHAYFGKGQAGFETGFRKWQIVPGIAFDYQTDPYVTSDKLTALAIATLSAPDLAAAERPFFAWFHYMDPHDLYQSHPDSPHFGKRPRDLYDEEVFWTDSWVGKLLDFVEGQPWASRTAIVVTADHGEAFGEHGITRHAHEVWEELVRVPLFVRLPGAAPRAIDAPRGHVDLAPTFVELLGAKTVPPLRGTSLVAELRGAPSAPRDVIVDLPEDELNERRRALIHGPLKLISFGNDVRYALYDLDADPKEATDLSRTRPDQLTEMRALYKSISKSITESPPRGGIPKR